MREKINIEIAPDKFIGDGRPCFIIAEIGSNHNNDIIKAKRLIDVSAEAGVDAVKFQTFRASSHYSKLTPGFSYLGNSNTFDLIKSLEINRDWHLPLKIYAEQQGLIFMSSPCDSDAINELDAIGTRVFKIASFDITDLNLIRQTARTGRPVIISTGMADWMDIQRALTACDEEENQQIVLLQCTSLYPAPANLSNLRAIEVMRDAFSVLIGYSDHTEGDHICTAAVALGACVIEKHITLDKTLPGPDHSFAIEPPQLKEMVKRIRDVEAAIGNGKKIGPRSEELEMYEKGRRSIHAAQNIHAGEIITEDMLIFKRPGLGILPHLAGIIIGRRARLDIKKDQWITWKMI